MDEDWLFLDMNGAYKVAKFYSLLASMLEAFITSSHSSFTKLGMIPR